MFLRRFRVRGHSMEPALRAGSSVLVLKTQRVKPGDIIVFRRDNDPEKVRIKRVVRWSNKTTLEVVGDNKADSEPGMCVCDYEIIGKVLFSY